MGLDGESQHQLESVLDFTKADSFYLLSAERLFSSSAHTAESTVVPGVAGGKAMGAYNRNVGVSRWQGAPWRRKRLLGKLLP